jgi:hypothetical protein
MTLRILKSRTFARWAKGDGVTDAALCRAAYEVAQGLIDAHLGGSLLKKRIGRDHGGKRGGFRTIIAYRERDRLIFMYGFAKSERDNIRAIERSALIALGAELMTYDDIDLARAIAAGTLVEIACDG